MGGQQTQTTRDRPAEIRLEEAMKELDRTDSALALKVWVYVFGRGRTREEARRIAEGVASIVMGMLSLALDHI